MRQIAATHRGDKSPRLHCCCDKAACAYFVVEIRATDRSDKIISQRQIFTLHYLLQQPVVATCRNDLSHRVSRPLN